MGIEHINSDEILVPMNSWDTLTVYPEQPKTITTHGLSETAAVAILTETREGFARGYLQHYHLDNKTEGIKALEEAIDDQIPSDDERSSVVIMNASRVELNKNADPRLKPIDGNHSLRLAQICFDGLGKRLELRTIPFILLKQETSRGIGTLAIHMGRKPTALARNIVIAEAVPIIPRHYT